MYLEISCNIPILAKFLNKFYSVRYKFAKGTNIPKVLSVKKCIQFEKQTVLYNSYSLIK